MDEKIENGRRKRLGVLEPLAACELDAKRSEKETRHVRPPGRDLFVDIKAGPGA